MSAITETLREGGRGRAVLFGALAPMGVLLGAVLFALSLTPSMVPRAPEIQGALGGIVFAIGYLLWYLLRAGVHWLGFRAGPWPPAGWRWAGYAAALGICVTGLWQGAAWQNSIRAVWGLDAIDAFHGYRVAAIAAAIFAVLLFGGRLFVVVVSVWDRRTARFLPPRVARAIGVVLAVVLFWTVIDGVAVRLVLRSIDKAAMIADLVIPDDLTPPTDPGLSGSDTSLIAWEDLGRWGRRYIASAPDRAEIGAFWGAPAQQPIRAYVGLTAAGSVQDRAQLAFDELKRVGGFDRKYLVIAMPTGSGWLDPGLVDTMEYVARGDVATVAIQYSYLNSPITVIVDPEKGIEEAAALFDLVYAHWTGLSPDRRPRLYLTGLSLGAYLSQETVPLLDVFGDPFHGAFWVGSPFLSEAWRNVLARRSPDSPAWRPQFGNGSLIRSISQFGEGQPAAADWGPIRLVFLQYGSDPIAFFDYSLAWRRPDWLRGARAPDLSPEMRWIPIVSLLQVGFDMAVAVGTFGHGHDYIARDYIPGWALTLDPEGWTPEIEARLVAHLRDLLPR